MLFLTTAIAPNNVYSCSLVAITKLIARALLKLLLATSYELLFLKQTVIHWYFTTINFTSQE